MGVQQSPPFQRRQLGALLRKLRAQAGWTFAETLRHAEISAGRLSRIETGEVPPDIPLAKFLLDLYGIPVNDWEPTLELVRAARQKAWWQAYGLSSWNYVAAEAAATRLQNFEIAFVPGLLQTEQYMVKVFRRTSPGLSGSTLANAVVARRIRQRRLTDDQDPLGLHAIIDETVAMRPVGSQSIMREQFEALLLASALDRVTLQVIKLGSGAHPGLMGAFTLLEFGAGHPDLLYMESTTGRELTPHKDQVSHHRARFRQLSELAADPDESRQLIKKRFREI